MYCHKSPSKPPELPFTYNAYIILSADGASPKTILPAADQSVGVPFCAICVQTPFPVGDIHTPPKEAPPSKLAYTLPLGVITKSVELVELPSNFNS